MIYCRIERSKNPAQWEDLPDTINRMAKVGRESRESRLICRTAFGKPFDSALAVNQDDGQDAVMAQENTVYPL